MRDEMIIDCISDLHGESPLLRGGDILIVAGDLTLGNTRREYINFGNWFRNQNYKHKVFIAGNHDKLLEKARIIEDVLYDFTYLQDSGVEIEGFKIWGSPWVRSFPGMNLRCKAFCLDGEEELKKKWDLIPDDTDILVTHLPPWGILDKGYTQQLFKSFGSITLREKINGISPKLCVFGHIHEGCGKEVEGNTIYVNASHLNEYYEPFNEPIRVVL